MRKITEHDLAVFKNVRLPSVGSVSTFSCSGIFIFFVIFLFDSTSRGCDDDDDDDDGDDDDDENRFIWCDIGAPGGKQSFGQKAVARARHELGQREL